MTVIPDNPIEAEDLYRIFAGPAHLTLLLPDNAEVVEDAREIIVWLHGSTILTILIKGENVTTEEAFQRAARLMKDYGAPDEVCGELRQWRTAVLNHEHFLPFGKGWDRGTLEYRVEIRDSFDLAKRWCCALDVVPERHVSQHSRHDRETIRKVGAD